MLLREIKQDTYCAKRIEVNKIAKVAEDWMTIEQDHRYLEEVLLHEYLTENIHLSENERKIARECMVEVGNFYQRAFNETDYITQKLKKKEEVEPKESKVKYRRD